MITRRDKLLNYPWQQQRYEQHRAALRSAKAAIDMRTPPTYSHIIAKPKKVQREKERLQRIEVENVRLLQKLGDIMCSKRLHNFWREPRPNFLNREKLFETRPHSTLPKLITIYGPMAATEQDQTQPLPALKSPNSKMAQRCRTCSGRPECTRVAIPEPRIPWQPPRCSWNVRTKQAIAPQRCLHCGHPQRASTTSNQNGVSN